MANRKDCEVCMQLMKKKHKHDKFYRIGFWVVSVLLAIVGTLYFSSGDLFRVTENTKETEVVIENESGNNNNNVNINQ